MNDQTMIGPFIKLFTLILLGFQLMLVCSGCGQKLEKKPWQKGKIEISPGLIIVIEGRTISSEEGSPGLRDPHLYRKESWETYELQIHWNGTNVDWRGDSKPLNLRAFEGRLFLITFDRTTKGVKECEFRYYAQKGNELKEIPPTQFPKAIAGQNMGFGDRYFGSMRDKIQIARDIDPTDIYFRRSLTGYIWNHLTSGEQYEESNKKSQISQGLLEEYIRVNKPIKLTETIRSTTNENTKAVSDQSK